ncbi:MAG TPA: DUF3999 domain-containing protein [Burkholderiales bacterium]|nr:DUF3999 domain-containing protein [Burkholderiales bacterium]
MKALTTFLLCLASAAAAQSPDEFAHALPIEGTGSDALYRIVISAAVYEGAAHADLRDLRVFNGANEPVPHAFRQPEAQTRKPDPVALALFPLHGPRNARAEDLDLSVGRAGDRVSVKLRTGTAGPGKALLGYLVDASAVKVPLSGLAVSWAGAGASQIAAVRVEGSDDLKHWTPLAFDVPLGAMSHAGQRLERDTVEFRTQRAKYLRLLWLDADRAMEISRIRGLPQAETGQPDRAWKEVAGIPDPQVPGDYAFDLGGRFPVDRIDFRLPQENTVAPLQLLSRASPGDKWMPVASGTVYRLQQDGRELASTPLAVATPGHRYWLARVGMKGGGIGSGQLVLRAGWTPRELIFTARGAGPFRLAYGNPAAEWSALPAETLVPGLRTDQAPKIAMATTGAPQKLAGRPAGLSRDEKKKWVLWAALLAGVGVLGWMAWRLSRQLQQTGGN